MTLTNETRKVSIDIEELSGGTIRSHSYQPSISVIFTWKHVRKYWCILVILDHLFMNSVPSSDDNMFETCEGEDMGWDTWGHDLGERSG